MNPTWLLMLAIFAPVLCGAAGLLLPRKEIGMRVAASVAGPALAVYLLGIFIHQHGFEAGVFSRLWMDSLHLNLQFNADKFGLFFALLISGIGVLITLYARAYFGPDPDSLYRFYPSLLLFMTAMLGVVLSDNFLLMLLFWEMTSISSFLLIGWERDDPSAVKKAMQAFVVTGAGGLAIMAGLALLGTHTGHWSFSSLAEFGVPSDVISMAAFGLIFTGAAAKSAQFPLHFWLPGAMAAPTPVSAYLHSATMVKAGVYLTGRLWPLMAMLPIWPMVIIPLGAFTMVWGAFIALQKEDLKQIFAYTTISQLGLLMCMYGLSAFEYHGEPNLIWDVTQILNHALYKAPLFILAGAIGHVASRQLPELNGFFWRSRTSMIMATVLLLAGYGLAAGPGTLSFFAKEFFFYQIYHAYLEHPNIWFKLLVGAGVATGMFNVAIFVRLLRTLVFAKPDTHHAHDDHGHGHSDHGHETGIWPAFLWVPGLIIVAFQFVGGLAPGFFDHFVLQYIEPSRFYEQHLPTLSQVASHLAHPELPLIMSGVAMVLGVILGLSPILTSVFKDPFDHAYPGFYTLVTKIAGPKAFGLVQRGHNGSYIAFVMMALVGLFLWTTGVDPTTFARQWPQEAGFEWDMPGELMYGALVTVLVCLTAILLPIVTDRASRVLILGTCGFGVTAAYYLYRAPDLALTQVSIEIVSLILFLLVLSLIPREAPKARLWVAPRIVLAIAVGVVMSWLTLTSSIGSRPGVPTTQVGNTQIANLGEYFLRNSNHGVDSQNLPPSQLTSGVVDRSITQGGHGEQGTGAFLHPGGGGNNVVNVILVDFRGFDTMGEITVLGLAAMGVWTLLRRPSKSNEQAWLEEENDYGSPDNHDDAHVEGKSNLRIDIPDPSDSHDSLQAKNDELANRSPAS